MGVKKPKKIRLNVTFTPRYIEGMNKLVESGVFLTTGDMIRSSLRMTFKKHGINLFEGLCELEENSQPS